MNIQIGKRLSQSCNGCGNEGKPVSLKTVLLMLKPELLQQAKTGNYSFCSTRNCPIVYFDQEDHFFTIDDLRVRVGLKVDEDPVPLCYCFGFDESHIRDEIVLTGKTTVYEKIFDLISSGLCACEARNPAGLCCLGEVKRSVTRLTANLTENDH